MDRRERMDDPTVAHRAAMAGFQSEIWTALPGILQSFDAEKITATVQPAIKARQLGTDGKWNDIALPLLLDVPVIFPGGGGFSLTFPLAQGDEGAVIFSSRCIDAWWQSGGVQTQAEMRMHDLSDGMFIPGLFSQPRKLSGVSTQNVQLRSKDGLSAIEITPQGICNLNFPAGIHLNGPIVLNGTVSGNIEGGGVADFGNTLLKTNNDVQAGGKSLTGHVHGGVQPGAGSTSPPT